MSDFVVANVLKTDLHENIELLKREIYRIIKCMSSFSDGILVLYGLCDSLRDSDVILLDVAARSTSWLMNRGPR